MSFTFTSQTLLSFTFTSQTCMSWMVCGARYEFQGQKRSALAPGRPQTRSASYTCCRLQMSWSPHQVPAMSKLRQSTIWQVGTIMDDTIGAMKLVQTWTIHSGPISMAWQISYAIIQANQLSNFLLHHIVLDLFSTRGSRTLQCGPKGFQINAIRRWIRM